MMMGCSEDGGAGAVPSLQGVLLPPAIAWGAAHTKARAEKKLAEFFRSKAIPYFLPLLRRRNVGNREVRWFHVPLFPGYVFYDVGAVEDKVVYGSKKVAGIVKTEDQGRLIGELEGVARALAADDRLVEARWTEAGRPVRIARGPLKGLEGELLEVPTGPRLLLRVHFIGRALSLEIDESLVEPQG